jgi:mRNA-degrading endonuclease RelE of RelBE toxin-antitoxin system
VSYTLIIHPKATKELENAVTWYEERSEGLGKRFLSAVNKRVLEIATYPQRYPLKHKNYREVGIDIFPFIIVYQLLDNDQTILITYIFHNKQSHKRKYLR